MPLLTRLSSLWRNLFHKARKDQELAEEIDAYLEMLVEQKINEGLDLEEAHRAALIELGGKEQVKAKVRDVRVGHQLETLWQDLRYALRMLLKQPVVMVTAIGALALGIGGNTAIFSVVNAVLLNAAPYYEPQRLVWITEGYNNDFHGVGAASYLNLQAQSQAFEHLVAFDGGRLDLTGRGEPERLESFSVTASMFPAFGVTPQLGRAFTPEEDQPEAPRVALLGHEFWQRRFGGDPAVIGQALTLGGQSRTVIGIMPPEFRNLGVGKGWSSRAVDVWLPLALNAQRELADDESNVALVGRLKPGFTLEQARSELNLVLRRLEQANPNRLKGIEARVTLLSEAMVGHLRLGLLALFGAVGLVLLIACANVANLLLGRASTRQKELAVRAALGAWRGRLVRQMLTESLLLSLLGGVAGLLLAALGVKALAASAPNNLAHLRAGSIDGAALGFTFLAALLTGAAAGLIPALQSSRIDLNEALKDGARKTATFGRRRLGRVAPVLVIGELALTLVLLVGAGLLIKSYLRMLAVEPGYDPEKLLSLSIPLDNKKYPPGSPQERAFYREVLTRVKAIPGVKAVATGSGLPLTGWSGATLLEIVGRATAPGAKLPRVEYSEISPDYFRTMGMRLLAGRAFTEQDDDKAPPVVIINETLARRYFNGENPIGKQILPPDPLTIVGVVSDVKRFGLDAETLPEIYCPYSQTATGPGGISLVTRTAGDPLDNENVDIRIARPTKGYAASGRVIDAETGKPVPGVMIHYGILKETGRGISVSFNLVNWPTNSAGEFRLEGLMPNNYKVGLANLEKSDFYSDQVDFEIVSGDVTGLEIKLSRGASISGVAVVEGSRDPAIVGALSKVELRVVGGDSKTTMADGLFDRTGAINADGTFKISPVRPGKKRIIADGYRAAKELSFIRMEHNGGEVRDLDIAAGDQVSGVRLVFGYGTAVIAGRVEIKGGVLPQTAILNVSADRDGGAPENPKFGKGARVDERKQFVIEGLAQGTYKVRLHAYDTATGEPIKVPSTEQTVTIAGNARHEITLVLDLTKKEDDK
jgi:putative ABC transport system permease protein